MGILSKPPIVYRAKNLDDAYKKGYYTGSITHREFMEKLQKVRPELIYIGTDNKIEGNKLAGLYFKRKGMKKFILGMSHCFTVPRFTIKDEEGDKVLIKGWESIVKRLVSVDRGRERGYCEAFGI